jgi:hypothetical protein
LDAPSLWTSVECRFKAWTRAQGIENARKARKFAKKHSFFLSFVTLTRFLAALRWLMVF